LNFLCWLSRELWLLYYVSGWYQLQLADKSHDIPLKYRVEEIFAWPNYMYCEVPRTGIYRILSYLCVLWVRVMVFNAIFNNISNISWWSVFLVEEPRITGENHRPAARHWQTLSHNIISSTPCLSGSWTHNISGNRHWLHR
jgi:hypothetical protein